MCFRIETSSKLKLLFSRHQDGQFVFFSGSSESYILRQTSWSLLAWSVWERRRGKIAAEKEQKRLNCQASFWSSKVGSIYFQGDQWASEKTWRGAAEAATTKQTVKPTNKRNEKCLKFQKKTSLKIKLIRRNERKKEGNCQRDRQNTDRQTDSLLLNFQQIQKKIIKVIKAFDTFCAYQLFCQKNLSRKYYFNVYVSKDPEIFY